MIAWRGNGLVAMMVVVVYNAIVNAIADIAWCLPQGLWGHPRCLPLASVGGHVAFGHFLLVLRQAFERTGRARRGARDRPSHRPNRAGGQGARTLLATRAVVERAMHGDGCLVLVGVVPMRIAMQVLVLP